MTPGTILFDTQFTFSDGDVGEKLLIVFNDGSVGYYLLTKTTSKGHGRGLDYGCQSNDRFPNFFLPKDSCCLHEQTWICLDEFYEFKVASLLEKHFSGRMRRIGILPDNIFKALLECAVSCDDITNAQAEVVKQTLEQLE